MVAQQIEQLKRNPEFIEKARNAESVEAFRELLASEGIEVDTETINSIMFKAGKDEELHERDLEDVAGGMIVGPSLWLIKWWKDIHKGSSGSSHGGGGRGF